MADGALRILNQVETSAKKNGYTQMPTQFSIAKVRALASTGTDHGLNEAKGLLQTALDAARRQGILGAQTDLLGQAGQMAVKDHNYFAAENSFSEEVRVAHQAGLPAMEADGLLHLSLVYRANQQNAKAEVTINQGIDAERHVAESYDLPNFVAEKAEVELALGRPKIADSLYDQAARLVEGLLVNAPSSRVKSSMIGAMSDIYIGHFRLAWNNLHDGAKAFEIVESARGRALLSTLGRTEPLIAGVEKSPAELQIAHLQSTLLHSKLSPTETKRVLAQLDRAYDNAFPLEYAANHKALLETAPVSLDVFKRQFVAGDTFVEYVLDQKVSYALEITTEGLTIHALPGRSEIDRLAKSYLSAITGGGDCSTEAKALYKTLLLPVLKRQTTRLVIVPDGPLHRLPFGALVDENNAYVVQRVAVLSAPSASVYFKLRSAVARERATKPFLGIAYSPGPGPTELAAAKTRGLFDLRGVSLSPLPYARQEVVTAAAMLGKGAVVLDGDSASEAALKAQPLKDFKVIHLASHTVGNEVEPDRAALVLAAGSDGEDGLWQAREIRRTPLAADVIVLSACETGVGRLQGEEGVMNLARAFLTAGGKSVVASLWSVEDRSTATIMESFYEHLATGSAVAEALRQAQLDFVRNYGEKAKPYLWAGFEVIGDGTRRIKFATNKIGIQAAR